jgi:hypothetical protein
MLMAKKKGPAAAGPLSLSKRRSALLVALLIDILLARFASLIGFLLALLACLALLLAGLLARLRLVLVPLIVLARLVLVCHVMNSMEVGLPQPFSEPAPATIVPQKSRSSKGFLVTSAYDQETGRPAFASAKRDRV